ncbi:MAG: hypothetical protein ACO3GJ_07510, partial [Burkholderiaceae bacterium]
DKDSLGMPIRILGVACVIFFRYRAQISWRFNLLLTSCGLAFMLGMVHMLNRDFPPGLLQSVVSLPWPLN